MTTLVHQNSQIFCARTHTLLENWFESLKPNHVHNPYAGLHQIRAFSMQSRLQQHHRGTHPLEATNLPRWER